MNSQRRIDHCDTGCTAEVYGQKHEIELPDGTVIDKMRGPNLRISEPVCTAPSA